MLNISATQSKLIQSVTVTFPQITIDAAQSITDVGQHNDILIVNEALVFRFAKFAEGVATLHDEVAILRLLQGQTTLPVPNPQYVSLDGGVGQAFMGYSLLTGEPLLHARLAQITDDDVRQQMARQLGQFLRELHAVPTEQLAHLTVQDTPDQWRDLYAQFQQHLFHHMRPDARQTVSANFEQYLADATYHAWTPSLRHGDFGSSNILFDAQRGNISGVIDFGFAGLGDAAVDLAAASTYGEEFFAHLLDSYPASDVMLARARFYKSTYALQEALYGVVHDDSAAFQAGIEDYI